MPLKRPAYIVDVDGTVANLDHRLHFLNQQPKNWKMFSSAEQLAKDNPIVPVIEVVNALWPFNDIVIVTAREGTQNAQNATINWLNQHDIPFNQIFFRKERDYRPDEIIKSEIYDEIEHHWEIKAVFDDRPAVVEMLRNRGYFVFDVNHRGHF